MDGPNPPTVDEVHGASILNGARFRPSTVAVGRQAAGVIPKVQGTPEAITVGPDL